MPVTLTDDEWKLMVGGLQAGRAACDPGAGRLRLALVDTILAALKAASEVNDRMGRGG